MNANTIDFTDSVSTSEQRVVLRTAVEARVVALNKLRLVAGETGDSPFLVVGPANHVFDRVRSLETPGFVVSVLGNLVFVGGFLAFVVGAAFVPWNALPLEWSGPELAIFLLLGGGLLYCLGMLSNIVARDLHFRVKHGYSRYFAEAILHHAGRLVAVGEKALYIRTFLGETKVIPLETVDHVLRVAEGEIRNLVVFGKDGKVIANTYDLSVADADAIAEAVNLHVRGKPASVDLAAG